MIAISLTGNSLPLSYTPFTESEGIKYLADKNIKITDHLDNADLIVSGTVKGILHSIIQFGWTKKYLLWTMEPRFNKSFRSKLSYYFLPPINIMNMYTGIFENNYFFAPEIPIPFNQDQLSEFKHKKIVALMTYQAGHKWRFLHDGIDLDLCNLRTKIAIEGYKKKCLDIYGRYWPDKISLGSSRGGNWQDKKIEILQQYHFNLCFENTNWPFYCTEKIWDSIQGGCLPIYYGKGNKIYDHFPKNSFLDYTDFNNIDSLFDYIDKMTITEFKERMSLCVEAYSQAVKKKKEIQPYKKILEKTADRIQKICN